MKYSILAGGLLLVTTLVPRQAPISADLQALVNTEREFAKTATVKGLRDSFLDYFADDSIALVPAPESARDRLRSQPSQPFSELEITWEPRLGDVAASNDIGWLTGPSTIIDHTAAKPVPRLGNYLSIWRRQPDGRWRVYIDVGANVPALPAFAPGFTRTPFGKMYAGTEGKEAATRSLAEADRAFNGRIASSSGSAAAYTERTTSSSRLHRPGSLSVVGTDAIAAWVSANAASMSAVSTAAEAAKSGEIGFSYGTYEVKSATPDKGAYVRVWTRDASGAWFVVADVTQPTR
jgi:ketosteroid isomerase-like protein